VTWGTILLWATVAVAEIEQTARRAKAEPLRVAT
jgi:hypothetical protein